MGRIIIEVKNLERTYPAAVPVKALRGVSFDVAEGEFVALMGRSGSGKSTLLHQLALFDEPTGGLIVIDGEDTRSLDSRARSRFRLEKIGYIFQEFAILTECTALENVLLPRMAHEHANHSTIQAEAIAVLERVGLGNRLHHYPSELSGGEQQRVVIARALINRPKILLADEPTASLDSESAEEVLELLSELNREMRQTIIMISHEEQDKRWADRVLWMKDGLIEHIENINKEK